jgi:hypothetical protein
MSRQVDAARQIQHFNKYFNEILVVKNKQRCKICIALKSDMQLQWNNFSMETYGRKLSY